MARNAFHWPLLAGLLGQEVFDLFKTLSDNRAIDGGGGWGEEPEITGQMSIRLDRSLTFVFALATKRHRYLCLICRMGL